MHISLIDDLLKAPLPSGSSILVEYDPASAWYPASICIAADWVREGGVVTYSVASQPPDAIRSKLKQLGMDVEKLEADAKLRLFDWYTATLGRKSKETYAFYSLKAADLSVLLSKYLMATEESVIAAGTLVPTPSPEWLRILDDASCLSRFNEEKSWVELYRTRMVPIASLWKSTGIGGIIKGIHSEWVYKNLEAACDGVIDFKLDETGEEAKSMIRIRSMRNVAFDSHWHAIKVDDNFNVSLEK